MAIDSAEKRFSILRFGKAPIGPLLPVSDGSFDAGDRLHLIWLYSGLTGGVTPPTGGEEDYYIIWGRRRGRR